MNLPRWLRLRLLPFSYSHLILQQLAVLYMVGVVDRSSMTSPPPDKTPLKNIPGEHHLQLRSPAFAPLGVTILLPTGRACVRRSRRLTGKREVGEPMPAYQS